MFVIVGLGNPGSEYENTRHNAGRMVVERIHATHDFSEWKIEKKPPFQSSTGTLSSKKVTLLIPDTFMNKSGVAVLRFVKSKKDVDNLIVIHDELDMPLGTFKISRGKSSGGHNGVESVIKAVKTKNFIRIRVGVSPKTPKGIAKKPTGEEKVLKFLLGKFSPDNLTEYKKVMKKVIEAVETIAVEGHTVAMNRFN
ncbi:aminoacyl-tRNA hydrolase [Patescibacteria group bacterium]|nr:aminoacyl-tRNA hydrolase [Patescibacteria group bacterium]